MNQSSLSVLQAAVISLINEVVTLVVAFAPAWAPEKQLLITVGGSVVTFAFLLFSAIHSHGVVTAHAVLSQAPDAQAITAAAVEAATEAARQAASEQQGGDVKTQVRLALAELGTNVVPVTPAPQAAGTPVV